MTFGAKRRAPLSSNEPHYRVFPEFNGASYAERYNLLLTKLVRARLDDAACLLLSPRKTGAKGAFREPNPELIFLNFATSLLGRADAVAQTQRPGPPTIEGGIAGLARSVCSAQDAWGRFANNSLDTFKVSCVEDRRDVVDAVSAITSLVSGVLGAVFGGCVTWVVTTRAARNHARREALAKSFSTCKSIGSHILCGMLNFCPQRLNQSLGTGRNRLPERQTNLISNC